MPEKSAVSSGMIHCISVSLPGRKESPPLASLLSVSGPSVVLVGSGLPLEPFPRLREWLLSQSVRMPLQGVSAPPPCLAATLSLSLSFSQSLSLFFFSGGLRDVGSADSTTGAWMHEAPRVASSSSTNKNK